MRRIVVLTFVSLDGVMQAPGGPDEDRTGGFGHGGWVAPYADGFFGEVMAEQMAGPYDLLLGRRTYDIFAAYWPKATGDPADGLNRARKYVVSRRDRRLGWAGSTLVTGDVVRGIRDIKAGDGPELQVHGSGELVQTLLEHDLVDMLRLKTFPITLGRGKRLFRDGAIPAAFRLVGSKVSPKGVIFADYERAGPLETGTVG